MNAWHVQWHHKTDSSSWWSDSVVRAETREQAAESLVGLVDEHTTHANGKRLRVRVFGPIPEEFEEFFVSKVPKVEPT
jgi:hypothetical protein